LGRPDAKVDHSVVVEAEDDAYAGMAIYDAIQHVRPDVSTICFGIGMSAAVMIMAGGAVGKRVSCSSERGS